MKQVFEAIGVNILFEGELPADEARGEAAANIIREAVTNAARHGFATEVTVEMNEMNGFHIRISDNGRPPAKPITEGGGLSGIRERVKPFGGSVHVSYSPQFILEADLPGGNIHV
jgi:signal transduction histidine kinase